MSIGLFRYQTLQIGFAFEAFDGSSFWIKQGPGVDDGVETVRVQSVDCFASRISYAKSRVQIGGK